MSSQAPPSPVRARFVSVVPVCLVSLLLVAFVWESAAHTVQAVDPWAALTGAVKNTYWAFWGRILSDPYFCVAIPLVFVFQFLCPVDGEQRALGAATQTDLLYTGWMMVMYGVFCPPFLEFLHYLYTSLFGWITITPAHTLPGWLEFLLGYLAIDFLGWFHHYVRHKVPAFWEFHAVHHSQTEMNPFTNERVHPLDWVIANTLVFIPAYFFSDALQIVVGYWAVHKALDHFNHSNVRTNLGWLRFIFVTPQSHRVHHSCRPEHIDMNFGVSLSIWDHMFGTQYRDYADYPETGVSDVTFPVERDGSMWSLGTTFLRQMIHPLVRVWQLTVPNGRQRNVAAAGSETNMAAPSDALTRP